MSFGTTQPEVLAASAGALQGTQVPDAGSFPTVMAQPPWAGYEPVI